MLASVEELVSLNLQTINLIVSLVSMLLAGVLLLQSKLVPGHPCIRWVAISNVTVGAGLLLVAMRGMISDFFSIIVGNQLAILGIMIWDAGFRSFVGERYREWQNYLLMAVTMILMLYFTYVENSIAYRIVTVSIPHTIILLGVAQVASGADRRIYKGSSGLITYSILFYLPLMFVRAFYSLLYPPITVFAPSLVQTISSLGMFVVSFLMSAGFILMIGQRTQYDLNEQALVDSLTQIPNRRAMQRLLELEMARKQRSSDEFCLLMLDIDHFKTVNDRFGHKAGDHVLKGVASHLAQAIRAQDSLSRWGGEEFMVLLPATAPGEACKIGERLRAGIELANFSYEDLSITLTVSVGVGCSVGAETVDDVFQRTDNALYKAKHTRNAVACSERGLLFRTAVPF